MNDAPKDFGEFLAHGVEVGGFATDDVLAAGLPLCEQVAAVHERGEVAPLDGLAAISVAGPALQVDLTSCSTPRKANAAVEKLQRESSRGVEVVGEISRTTDLVDGRSEAVDRSVGAADETISRPVFLPGYVSWEHRVGHHDQLTDVFSVGLLLASVACGLDFRQRENLEEFVRNRDNLFRLNPRLHPVVAQTIVQMTELNRHRRAQTLEFVIRRLRRYRDLPGDAAIGFEQLEGYRGSPLTERGKIILTHLRNRLFEISRRNRLIYYRATMQTLNLTLASVPVTLDYRNIQPSQLFLWNDDIAGAMARGETLQLGKYVRFEDAPYASSVLDQIIAAERRDRQEFGFSQLRLVVCFLRWHNLRESPQERIQSPLLLLPVEVTRRKGVRDAYFLRPTTTEAEINPALRHHLHQLYGLKLPEAINLGETTLAAFHAELANQIRASEPAVELERVERPQVQLIHERARQRLDQFRRRQRAGGQHRPSFDALDYSYDHERYRPLGLRLFQSRVKPSRPELAQVLGKAPAPRSMGIIGGDVGGAPAGAGPVIETSNHFYALKQPDGTGNPYQWEFDLCSLTLGNFNYRKMSLVRDYAALLEHGGSGRAFDTVFSLEPRAPAPAIPELAAAERYPVVDCDPTQGRAVAQARLGQSYVIQGPPGTGKSQTITNLIADFVARGKRVLFVCAKRAAIDVVYHRLGRQGLEPLCCLIHDSQTDKREFIRDLKQTYEDCLKDAPDDAVEARRRDLVAAMEADVAALAAWSQALESAVAGGSATLKGLLERLIELRADRRQLDLVDGERVPGYGLWSPHAAVIKALTQGLNRVPPPRTFAEHSFRVLDGAGMQQERPLAAISAALEQALQALPEIERALADAAEAIQPVTLEEIDAVIRCAEILEPAAAADALEWIDARSAKARQAAQALKLWREAEQAAAKAEQSATGWKKKLSPVDTGAALAEARRLERNPVRWLQPSFWRLRRTLQDHFDFASRAIVPSWSSVLELLLAEQVAEEARAAGRKAADEACGDVALEDGARIIEELPRQVRSMPPAARAFVDYLVENPEATLLVENLARAAAAWKQLRGALAVLTRSSTGWGFSAVRTELTRLRTDLTWLPDLLPVLGQVLQLPAELQAALRALKLSDTQLEAAMAARSVAEALRSGRVLADTDGPMLARRIAWLEATYREWIAINARWIRQLKQRDFLRKVQLAAVPAAQLTAEQKELKRSYTKGRRELEHEFSKTMRFRTVRDLAGEDTGVVLRDLKPVWLMSPLSVSDTLPLASDAFDVVIFDEASQIPVEEAIPAVNRAQQIIVVGDEMQLPPTNFFSASRSEDAPLLDGDEGMEALQDLDADSFLTQAGRNLSSVMLGWHYRSRSEALINFSNHAFYAAKLLTVPDLDRAPAGQTEIEVRDVRAGDLVDAVLAKPVSYLLHPAAVYENRSNAAEAETIAALVRELLQRETRLSIGVVAFSEAQQSEIERALDRLGAADAAFKNRLEAEYERAEEGQFCGLFVKNLENVQGDERDVILLSVCYGYDRARRMLMNFGPINQRGGEKRLNVIFSRARKHMAIVSSIRHSDITNEHNDGANCLKSFLEYAAACSAGDGASARRVLRSLTVREEGARASVAGPDRPQVLAEQIAEALRAKGWIVDQGVGQSDFKLPLAVRRDGDRGYALGILLDDPAHYAQRDLMERFLLRPALLRGFGWRVIQVYG